MVMLVDKIREEGLADLLSRPFGLRHIGGTHPRRDEVVLRKPLVYRARVEELVEGSRMV